MLRIITGIIASYLIGSIPTAFIFGKLLKGIDIRKFGSGNVGATNALRVLGNGPGAAVLILDIIKGVIPLLFADFFLPQANGSADIYRVILGVACICGHNWTVFLNFRGGKGIATTLGVLIGLALKTPGLGIVLLLVVLCWLLVFVLSRIVSLASVVSAVLLPAAVIFFQQSKFIIFASILLAFFVLLRHKPNLVRLWQGREKKLEFGKKH